MIQDRMFDTNGMLYFPDLPTNPSMHPFWTPEFIGDVITVNGKTWPYMSVAPRKYRFRLLNGSNARFYALSFRDQGNKASSTPLITQVGTDGGLMDSPSRHSGQLLLAPGERTDVVIDFSRVKPNSSWILGNSARAPYPKGRPPQGSTLGRVMQFVVNGKMVSAADNALTGTDKSQVPASLRAQPIVKLTDFKGTVLARPTVKRQLTLNEIMGTGGPLMVVVDNTRWTGNITEQPKRDGKIPMSLCRVKCPPSSSGLHRQISPMQQHLPG